MTEQLDDWSAGPRASWIVVDTDAEAFDCRRCLIHEPFAVPVRSLREWTAEAQAFVEEHRRCRAPVREAETQEALGI